MEQRKRLCTLGIFDIPIIQMQPPFVVDLLESNIAVFGTAMSGKTFFLKNLINILHKQYDEKTEQIFVLDFGGALFECTDLPLVSAYFDNSNEEYVKRVFKILENILKENIDRLNGKNFRDSQDELLHTTFIIDNINSFLDEPRYVAYQEKLAKLCRDGLSKGITVVITAADSKGVVRYLGNYKQKIAFEMPKEKYLDIFSEKVDDMGNRPGHGYANVTVKPEGVTGTFRMNSPYEVQVTFPQNEVEHEATTYVEQLHRKYRYCEGEYAKKAKKYYTFPKELTKENYLLLCQDERIDEESVGLGLDYVDFRSVALNLYKSHVVGIYGKKEFGKTNLLELIVSGITAKNNKLRLVFFDDGREQLSDIYDSIPTDIEKLMFNSYADIELTLCDGLVINRKLSPLQQFYVYLNQNYLSLDKRFMAGIYGLSKELSREFARIPDCEGNTECFTVFVIQSKLVYLNSIENKYFINSILPQLASQAEERGMCFIFSDIQKMSDMEQNMFFNNSLNCVFLLDNIAEFAMERGQKTIFGNMDVKMLKEDYARCELGDGYFYDIEADILKKLKFIKEE